MLFRSAASSSSFCATALSVSEDVHRIEKSSEGSMSMKDVELLNEHPRQASESSGALQPSHAREKLPLRDGEASIMQYKRCPR